MWIPTFEELRENCYIEKILEEKFILYKSPDNMIYKLTYLEDMDEFDTVEDMMPCIKRNICNNYTIAVVVFDLKTLINVLKKSGKYGEVIVYSFESLPGG